MSHNDMIVTSGEAMRLMPAHQSPSRENRLHVVPEVAESGTSDQELVEAAGSGTQAAFGALFERHEAAARRLARQLAHCQADADDLVSESFVRVFDAVKASRVRQFRAYLLTTLRHLAYDVTRKRSRTVLVDEMEALSGPSRAALVVQFRDTAIDDLDSALMVMAFERLSKRHREVLWRTEVEGQTPAEAGPHFGLSANGTSALAYRAKIALRAAFLQAHLSQPPAQESCQVVRDNLGVWTRGQLSTRKAKQVESHLAECANCSAEADELHVLNLDLPA